MNKQSEILTAELLRSKIYEGLSLYRDPYLSTDLHTAGCITKLTIDSRHIFLQLRFGFILEEHLSYVTKQVKDILTPIINRLSEEVNIELTLDLDVQHKIATHRYNNSLQKVPNIKNIIAIGSGKGGVGKSTVAVNIAVALQQQGAKVGILDADLYGPSLPHMLNCPTKVELIDNKLEPHYSCGIHCISIANLLAQEDTPLMWKGPMVSSGLLQLLYNTKWPGLDYLIVDLPPGTGDIQLTLAQKIPVTAAVIVTTPQKIAVLDAQKSFTMLQKLNVPILGVIENMSFFVCLNCNAKHEIFGVQGGSNLAAKYNVELLGSIPMELPIIKQSDLGTPTVAALPDSQASKIYHDIATKIGAKLSLLPLEVAVDNIVAYQPSSNTTHNQ